MTNDEGWLEGSVMLRSGDWQVLTFDCYGTLIDWESGIWKALQPVLAAHQVTATKEKTLELYAELEAEAERGEYREYKSVLKMVLAGFGSRLGFVPTLAELQNLPDSIKNWLPFPDTVAALQVLKKKYKLAIISNVDDDLFAFSAQHLQVSFDWVITAQQVRSYKPSLNNFNRAIERIGVPKDKILHVAQSLFHDIVPAKAVGLPTVWVNRRYDQEGFGATPAAQAQPDWQVPDLKTLAELAT
jgi:2-haloacid dehalogenase